MKCSNCQAVLSGEPTCPTCGTLYTVSKEGVSIPAMVEDIEARLGKALEGRYELRGLLGHGGMGAVFLAVELRLDRLVAIKVLPPSLSLDEEVLTRFEREARTAARLDHPGIVPIYAVEDVDGLHFYVMKFVPGVDLSDEIAGRPMDPDRARELLWEAAVALGHAHRRGVIHRDVKPANIMLDQTGRAMVTDFGIAKAVRSGTQMTSTGQMIGTPQYMSPEQMEGKEVDGRADQYSLGMVAWHMLAGRQPFEGGSVASLLVKQLHEYPESLAALRPEVPDSMIGAIERAIRKDPEERFQSMEAFASELWPERGSGMGTPAGTPSLGRSTGTPRTEVGGRKWVVAGGAGLLIGAAAIAGVLATGMFESGPESPAGAEVSLDGETEAALQTGSTVQGGAPVTSGGVGGGAIESSSAGDETEGDSSGRGGAAEQTPSTQEAPDPAPPLVGATDLSADATADEPASGGGAGATSVSTGAQQPTTAAPVMGYLTVGAAPEYGYVEIDGVELPNPTPVFSHPLAPGTYVIAVRREGYVTVVDTVDITSGNETRRNVVLVRNE